MIACSNFMGKFYAVRVGRKPGIYSDWAEVKPLVDGFAGAQHKSFKSRSEAEKYLGLTWIERGERGSGSSKRSRDDWDDDDDFDYPDPPPAPALRQNPYLPPSDQNARGPPSRGDDRSGRGASLSGRGAAPAPVLPTIGVMILGGGAPEVRSASAARNLTTGRAVGVSGGTAGGVSRGGGRYEPVIEGPLQPISSGTLYQLVRLAGAAWNGLGTV